MQHFPQRFFAFLIIGFIIFILLKKDTKIIEVIIQAGHEGRTHGNTGAVGKKYTEQAWTVLIANEVAKQLKLWKISVKRVSATIPFSQAKIAISIHFDGSTKPCQTGASIGYPSQKSYRFAQKWKKAYTNYFPFKWHKDNFTKNLKYYYGYRKIKAEKFLLLELGEITCEKQTKWLKPRLKKIAYLIALTIADELKREPIEKKL